MTVAGRDPKLRVALTQGTDLSAAKPGLIAAFRFRADVGLQQDSAIIDLCLPPLGATNVIETWTTSDPVRYRREGKVRIAESPDHAFAVIQVSEQDNRDLRKLTYEAYLDLLSAVQTTSCPHIIKIWNYFDRINEGDGDQERYRQFSWGRADAFEKMTLMDEALPTGTAIGTQGGDVLSLIALLSRHPLHRFENPRQVAAYSYPRKYGPRSPKFSRAGFVSTDDHCLFMLSGTAAVVGHESTHPFDLAAQADETFNNLDLLCQVAQHLQIDNANPTLDENSRLRVYLRNPSDYELVADQFQSKLGRTTENVAFLHGDICRRELQLEIDGVRVG